jgi:hypothetical protein
MSTNSNLDVNSVLRKISKRLNIPYTKLVNALYDDKPNNNNKNKNKKMTTLEYLRYDGNAYYYDPIDRTVYSYGDDPKAIGHMNDFMELESDFVKCA